MRALIIGLIFDFRKRFFFFLDSSEVKSFWLLMMNI